MFKHNVFNLLKEFSSDEVRKVQSFLDSPYHNKNKNIRLLFSEIQRFYPGFANQKLTKEFLYKKIYPSSIYNDSTFRNLMSGLLKLIEDFLTIEELSRNGFEKSGLLLNALSQKKQYPLFDKHLKTIIYELDKKGVDSLYFYNKSLVEMRKFNYNIINYQGKTMRLIEKNTEIIISYIIYLLNYFITELINSYFKLSLDEAKYNLKAKSRFPLQIIKNINLDSISKLSKDTRNNFMIEIYSHLFFTFQHFDNHIYYTKYKNMILKYSKHLSRDELSFHFSMLIFYCMYQNAFMKDSLSYDSELFTIYGIFLKQKFFIDNKTKYIDEDLYRNILLISLRLKRYKWSSNFIKTYSKYLHPKKKKNLLNLSFAEYYYYLGASRQSLDDLNRVFNFLKEIQEDTFTLKYDVKILYLMLYYDLNYNEPAITLLNNHKRFLNRNKLVTENQKKKLNKFLNLFERLIYFKEGDPNVNISDLYYDITRLKDINHRSWFLNKIKEFKLKKSKP